MAGVLILVLLVAQCALAQAPGQPAPDQWFQSQRSYPFSEIPEGALNKALQQRQLLEQRQRVVLPFDAVERQATATWTSIGPAPVSSPEGTASGRVTAIVVDSRNPDTVFIGAAGGGVWRSTDAGATWQALGDTMLSMVSGSLALDERNNVLYYGTGDHGAGTPGNGVLRSHDGGNTWINSNGWDSERNKPQFSGGTTPRLVLHPTEPRVILAARSSGLWRSADGGDTWIQVTGGVATDVAVDPRDPSRMYLALGRNAGAAENGVYRSSDGGQNWGRVSGLPGGAEIGRVSVAVAASDSAVYALMARSSDQQLFGVYRSNDGGSSWTRLPAPASLFDSDGRGHGYFDNFVAVDPRDSNIVYLGGVELWKSTDGGANWTVLSLAGNTRVIHEDQFAMAFKPGNPDTIYVGGDGGIYKSTDGGATWTSLNGTLAITQFNSLAMHPRDSQILLGGTQDNGLVRFSGGATWDQLIRGDVGPAFYDPANPDVIIIAKQRIRPMRSGNGGANFAELRGGIDASDRVSFYPPLAIPPVNAATIYFGTYRVWQTTDAGGSWRAIGPDLTGGSATLTALAVSSDGNTVFAGTGDGRVWAGSPGIWTRSNGVPDRSVTSIVSDPRNPRSAYLTVSGFLSGHVFKTTDGGLNWTDISGNLPDAPANTVAIDPRGVVYVGTDVGVFRTEDEAQWTSFNIGLPNALVTALALDSRSGVLTAATYGRGAFQINLRAPQSGPNVLASGVLNAATYRPVVAPGSIAALFGSRLANITGSATARPLPTTMGGVSVTVNGATVPLLFVSPTQINFQFPFEVTSSEAVVTVTTSEGSASTLVQVLPTAPGLFDGTLTHATTGARVTAANPAVPGEVVTLFATGLGATTTNVATGAASPTSPLAHAAAGVSARVGDRATPVTFAGLAPGFTGLYQINLVIPDGVSGSPPLVISAGGRASNALTVAVR